MANHVFHGPRAFVDHQTLVDDKQTLRREREREGRGDREVERVANIVNKEPPINPPCRRAKHGASDNTDYIYAVYVVYSAVCERRFTSDLIAHVGARAPVQLDPGALTLFFRDCS